MTPLGVGLIGTGKHGSRYARHIREDLGELVRLVGLARRDRRKAEEQAAALGCRAFEDYRELIAAPDVEALVVVVPPTLHPTICADIVTAGKPALFEKPAAASLAAARRMLDLLGHARAPLMVAQTLRYNSVVRAIQQARPQIGPIHALRLSQRFEPSPLGWIDTPEISGGGMILHTGVHSFDLTRLLTDLEVERVLCEADCVETTTTEDNFAATLRLRGGVLASVAGSRATHSRTGPIELVGRDGLLQGDHVHASAGIVVGTRLTPIEVAPPVPTVLEVMRDFAGAILASRPVPIPLIEGLRAVAIADACVRSATEGRAVEVAALEMP